MAQTNKTIHLFTQVVFKRLLGIIANGSEHVTKDIFKQTISCTFMNLSLNCVVAFIWKTTPNNSKSCDWT